MAPVPLSTRSATPRAISSGVSPPTAIGAMKISNTVEVRFWNRMVLSTAPSPRTHSRKAQADK